MSDETPLTFTCAECGGTFEFGSDEEARAEAAERFPGVHFESMAVVCDDCYKKLAPPSIATLQRVLSVYYDVLARLEADRDTIAALVEAGNALAFRSRQLLACIEACRMTGRPSKWGDVHDLLGVDAAAWREAVKEAGL